MKKSAPETTSSRLDIKIGFKCNNFCRFCVQGNKRFFIPRQQLPQLRAILEQSRDRTDSVVFTGGEPTLHPAFLDLVRSAADLGYRSIQVQTNGRTLSDIDFCRAADEAGATEFSPAVHGHIPELHDFLTRAPGSFRETLAAILNLRKLGLPVITNTVVTRSNFRHLPDIARLLARLDVTQLQFAFVHPVGRAALNFWAVVPRMSLIRPFVAAGLDAAAAAGITAFTEAIPYCFMQDREHAIAERHIPATRIVELNQVIEDFTDYRVVHGKAKGPLCARCSKNSVCEGPWKEYPEKYGWDEFVPC